MDGATLLLDRVALVGNSADVGAGIASASAWPYSTATITIRDSRWRGTRPEAAAGSTTTASTTYNQGRPSIIAEPSAVFGATPPEFYQIPRHGIGKVTEPGMNHSRDVVTAEYFRLCGRIGLVPCLLDVYIIEEGSFERSPGGLSVLGNATPGYRPDGMKLPQEFVALTPLAFPPAGTVKMGARAISPINQRVADEMCAVSAAL